MKEEGCEPLPAKSTIHALLERNGLVKHRKKTRHKSEHPGKPYVETEAPNDVWAADFKGEFKTLDGVYCYPLTIMDLHTRFILKVKALQAPRRNPSSATSSTPSDASASPSASSPTTAFRSQRQASWASRSSTSGGSL